MLRWLPRESTGLSSRHCCPTAQLMGREPSFTSECGADGSKKQVSHLCSVSLWTWRCPKDMACDGRPRSGWWCHPCSDFAVGEHSPHQGGLRSHSTGQSPKASAPVLLSMSFALFQHFQGPCAFWMWFLSALLPPHRLLTSRCLTAHIPVWLMAHGTVQLRQAESVVSICLIMLLFSLISISQVPILCLETSGVVSGSASPQ